jgi:Ig-like domain from next to BRCA1 gene
VDEKRKAILIPLVVGTVGLVMAHHKMVLSGLGFTQSDPGDTRFIHITMEHVLQWALGRPMHPDFWSPPSFFPITGHMAWADVMAAAVPFYAPWRLFFEPFTAFQLWGLTMGALNFTSAHVLLKRCFGFTTWASAVGAALFAFSAVRINQTMHWQLFPAFFTVWGAHAAYRLANASTLSPKHRVRYIALLAGSAVAQLWVGIYLGWFMTFIFVVGTALGLAFWPKARTELFGLVKAHPVALAVAAALALAALYPMAWRYAETAKTFGSRPYSEVMSMLPMARVWFNLGDGSWLWGWTAKHPWFQGIPMAHEQRCGFGFIATAVALFTFIRLRAQQRIAFVGVLFMVLILTTTMYAPDGTSPWKWVYDYFPAAQAIRAVARSTVVYMLGISVGVAAALTALAQHQKLKQVVVPLGALLIFEQGYTTPAFSKAQNNADIAEIVRQLEPDCYAFVLSPVQGYGPYWKYQLDAMWAAVLSGVPTMNGYSGQSPPQWALGDTNLRGGFDENRVSQAAQLWVNTHPSLQGKKLCWARVGFNEGQYANAFVSQQVPTTMTAGQQAPVELTFKNLGPRPWPVGVNIRLGSLGPADNARWGMNRVNLPEEVPVGGSVTFRFAITAPPQPGKYGFHWRMVHDGVQWLGATSKFTTIDVAPAEANFSAPPSP